MKKVNLFEELLQERNKQISTNELTSLLKNIWTEEDSKKERITQSLKDTNNGSFISQVIFLLCKSLEKN